MKVFSLFHFFQHSTKSRAGKLFLSRMKKVEKILQQLHIFQYKVICSKYMNMHNNRRHEIHLFIFFFFLLMLMRYKSVQFMVKKPSFILKNIIVDRKTVVKLSSLDVIISCAHELRANWQLLI